MRSNGITSANATLSCSVIAAALSEPAAAQVEQLERAAIAGRHVVISAYARTNHNCEGIDPPTIEVVSPPKHGLVCWLPGDSRLENVIEGNLRDCIGQRVHGIHIRYISYPDYLGSDDVRYTVHFPGVDHTVETRLTVRPDDKVRSRSAGERTSIPPNGRDRCQGAYC